MFSQRVEDFLKYEAKDMEHIDYVIKQEWQPGDLLYLRCWNREEAETLRDYVKRRYPEVTVRTSWMNFT